MSATMNLSEELTKNNLLVRHGLGLGFTLLPDLKKQFGKVHVVMAETPLAKLYAGHSDTQCVLNPDDFSKVDVVYTTINAYLNWVLSHHSANPSTWKNLEVEALVLEPTEATIMEFNLLLLLLNSIRDSQAKCPHILVATDRENVAQSLKNASSFNRITLPNESCDPTVYSYESELSADSEGHVNNTIESISTLCKETQEPIILFATEFIKGQIMKQLKQSEIETIALRHGDKFISAKVLNDALNRDSKKPLVIIVSSMAETVLLKPVPVVIDMMVTQRFVTNTSGGAHLDSVLETEAESDCRKSLATKEYYMMLSVNLHTTVKPTNRVLCDLILKLTRAGILPIDALPNHHVKSNLDILIKIGAIERARESVPKKRNESLATYISRTGSRFQDSFDVDCKITELGEFMIGLILSPRNLAVLYHWIKAGNDPYIGICLMVLIDRYGPSYFWFPRKGKNSPEEYKLLLEEHRKKFSAFVGSNDVVTYAKFWNATFKGEEEDENEFYCTDEVLSDHCKDNTLFHRKVVEARNLMIDVMNTLRKRGLNVKFQFFDEEKEVEKLIPYLYRFYSHTLCSPDERSNEYVRDGTRCIIDMRQRPSELPRESLLSLVESNHPARPGYRSISLAVPYDGPVESSDGTVPSSSEPKRTFKKLAAKKEGVAKKEETAKKEGMAKKEGTAKKEGMAKKKEMAKKETNGEAIGSKSNGQKIDVAELMAMHSKSPLITPYSVMNSEYFALQQTMSVEQERIKAAAAERQAHLHYLHQMSAWHLSQAERYRNQIAELTHQNGGFQQPSIFGMQNRT